MAVFDGFHKEFGLNVASFSDGPAHLLIKVDLD